MTSLREAISAQTDPDNVLALPGEKSEDFLEKFEEALKAYDYKWLDAGVTPAIPGGKQLAAGLAPVLGLLETIKTFLSAVQILLNIIEQFLMGLLDIIATALKAIIGIVRSLLDAVFASLMVPLKILYVPIIPAQRLISTGTATQTLEASKRKLFDSFKDSLIARDRVFARHLSMEEGTIYLSEESSPSTVARLVEAADPSGGASPTPELTDYALWNFGATFAWEQWYQDFKDTENLTFDVLDVMLPGATRGGLAKMKEIFTNSLNDSKDSARPQFGANAAVAGFCMIWGAADITAFLDIIKTFKDLGWSSTSPANSVARTVPIPSRFKATKIPASRPANAWAELDWDWPQEILDSGIFTDSKTRIKYEITRAEIFRYRGPGNLGAFNGEIGAHTGGVGPVSAPLGTSSNETLECIYSETFSPTVTSSLMASVNFSPTRHVDQAAPFSVPDNAPEEGGYRLQYAMRFRYRQGALNPAQVGSEVVWGNEAAAPLSSVASLAMGTNVVRAISTGNPPDWIEISFGEFAIPFLMDSIRFLYGFLDDLEDIIDASVGQLKKIIEDITNLARKWVKFAEDINNLVIKFTRILATLLQLSTNGFYFYGLQGNSTILKAIQESLRVPPMDPTDPTGLTRLMWDDPRLDPKDSSYDASLATVSESERKKLLRQPQLYDNTLIGGVMFVAGSDALDAFVKLVGSIFGFALPINADALNAQAEATGDAATDIESAAETIWEHMAEAWTFDKELLGKRTYVNKPVNVEPKERDSDFEVFGGPSPGPVRNRAFNDALEVVRPSSSSKCGDD